MFFRILYNLTGTWNLDIEFFQVLIYCNFRNFGSIFSIKNFKNTKIAPYEVSQSSIQSDNFIESYRVYDLLLLQKDTFVKTVFF